MLLSKKSIESKINCANPFLSGTEINDNLQSSSIDLTVNSIFLPHKNRIKKLNEICDYSFESYNIKAGETVIVEVSEQFNMPVDIGGIVFPRNKLSKQGLLMTNPGHIDPGFKGKITVCLVNMAGDDVPLKKGDSIITLLLFKVDGPTPGLKLIKPSTGVSIEQLNSITNDFADVSGRIRSMAKKYIWKNAAIVLAAVSLVLAIILVGVPLIFTMIAPPSVKAIKEGKINETIIAPLSERVKKIEDGIKQLNRDGNSRNTEVQDKQKEEIIQLGNDSNRQKASIEDLKKQVFDIKNQLLDLKAQLIDQKTTERSPK